MGESKLKKAGGYLGRRTALRLIPWAWPVYGGLGVYRAVAHQLTQSDRDRLWRLARKSLGVPSRLSAKERGELRRIFAKLNPVTVARFIAAEASPLPWPKAPASR